MDNGNTKWLTTVPATDVNFISHLHMATDEEIEWLLSKHFTRKGIFPGLRR